MGELLALEPYRTAGCVVAALHQLLVGGVDRVGRRLRRIVEVVFEIYVCRQAVHALRVERRNRDVAVLVVFEQEGVVVAQRGDAPALDPEAFVGAVGRDLHGVCLGLFVDFRRGRGHGPSADITLVVGLARRYGGDLHLGLFDGRAVGVGARCEEDVFGVGLDVEIEGGPGFRIGLRHSCRADGVAVAVHHLFERLHLLDQFREQRFRRAENLSRFHLRTLDDARQLVVLLAFGGRGRERRLGLRAVADAAPRDRNIGVICHLRTALEGVLVTAGRGEDLGAEDVGVIRAFVEVHLDLLLAVLHHRIGRFAGEGGAAAECRACRIDLLHAVEDVCGQRFERRAVEEHLADGRNRLEIFEQPLGNGLERRTAAEYVSGRYAFFHTFREVVRRRLHELRAVFPDRGDGLQRDAVFQRGELGHADTTFVEIAARLGLSHVFEDVVGQVFQHFAAAEQACHIGDLREGVQQSCGNAFEICTPLEQRRDVGELGHVLEQLCGQGFECCAAEESRREAVRFRLVGEECFGNALERCAVVEDASEVGQGGHVGQQSCRNAFQRLAAAEQAGCRGGFCRLFEEFFRDAF